MPGDDLPFLATLAAAVGSAVPVLALALATTGLCFLGLWSVRLVEPSPRCGAALLLISAAGAARALVDTGPLALARERWLPFVAAPLLLFVALFTLLGQDEE